MWHEGHEELSILRAELEGQAKGNIKVRKELGGGSTEQIFARSMEQMTSFEAYGGEVRYLRGMLRECKGEKKAAVYADVVTTEEIERLQVEVQALKPLKLKRLSISRTIVVMRYNHHASRVRNALIMCFICILFPR